MLSRVKNLLPMLLTTFLMYGKGGEGGEGRERGREGGGLNQVIFLLLFFCCCILFWLKHMYYSLVPEFSAAHSLNPKGVIIACISITSKNAAVIQSQQILAVFFYKKVAAK